MTDKLSLSPLGEAVFQGNFEDAERLLQEGHDPDQLVFGHLPIIQMALDVEADSYHQAGETDRGTEPPSGRLVELFLKAGADPYLVDKRSGHDTFDAAYGSVESQPHHPGALEMLARYGFKRRTKE